MKARQDEIRLSCGRLRFVLGLLVIVLALTSIVLSGLNVVAKLALLILLLVAALRFWSRGRHPDAGRLVFHSDQTLTIDGARGRLHADFVMGPMVAMRLDLDPGRRCRCVLFRDEMDDGSWRRLRARLRHP